LTRRDTWSVFEPVYRREDRPRVERERVRASASEASPCPIGHNACRTFFLLRTKSYSRGARILLLSRSEDSFDFGRVLLPSRRLLSTREDFLVIARHLIILCPLFDFVERLALLDDAALACRHALLLALLGQNGYLQFAFSFL